MDKFLFLMFIIVFIITLIEENEGGKTNDNKQI